MKGGTDIQLLKAHRTEMEERWYVCWTALTHHDVICKLETTSPCTGSRRIAVLTR